MFREIFGDGESGDGEDLLFAHDAHGFVAELESVVNGLDARARGVESAGFSGGVNGDAVAGACGFADCDGEFFFGVLIWCRKSSVGDRIGACFVNFDEVRAFL